ncbi:MAG TPA: single-stranded DNA-binding protein [Marmoricola sp.]|jgi:single-strand DNA-binding protein|nr:single-stranded DNA-binding protein [Marmoricola sp.]
MARRSTSAKDAGAEPDDFGNEVLLRGRVRSDAELRELPSGTALVTLRVVVPRSQPDPSGRKASDWVDCAVWSARLRARLGGWRAGDLVEVRGSLRRRFYRAGGDTGTRLEVEVSGGRMLRRASS